MIGRYGIPDIFDRDQGARDTGSMSLCCKGETCRRRFHRLYTGLVKEGETKPAPDREPPSRPAWRHLVKTTEGRILVLGVAAAILGFIVMGLLFFWSPEASRMFGIMSFANAFFGRAVSMSLGYAGGYDHALVVPVNMWMETVFVLLFYPLFVFSVRKLVVFPSLKRFLDRTHEVAERHHEKVRRYGTLGLFIFVWFPFWMTGPVVGAAIGYLLGFQAWLTLSIVLAGTYIAILGWAWLLFDIHTRAAVLGSWVPAVVVAILVLIALAGYWLNPRRKT